MSPITKAANQRLASLLFLGTLPLLGYLLGRQSMTFTGSRLEWLALGGNLLALAAGLYEAAKGIRNAP